MSHIKQLPTLLANQIAAGEVIERPASVVKELVENALDAGSSRIQIELKESGLSQITVIDDGSGMSAADLPLAILRHATSKITGQKDLFQVKTLGFRGEALPSIAAVADVTITSIARGEAMGHQLHVAGGKADEVKPAAIYRGTKIVVNDLFYNTPARRKYLASPQTELAQISDIVNRIALSHPQVSVTLTHNNKQLLKTAGNGKLPQTFAAIYGIKVAQKMRAFTKIASDGTRIEGLISLPELTRAAKSYISLFVNGRYIKNRKLQKAILQGYGSKLMVGRYPFASLAVTINPLDVDVNVHPTKQEVRFSNENELCQLITSTIYQRLQQENLIPDAQPQEPAAGLARSQTIKPEQMKLTEANQVSDFVKPAAATAAPEAKERHAPVMISTVADLKQPAMTTFLKRHPQLRQYQITADFVPTPAKTEAEPTAKQAVNQSQQAKHPAANATFPNLQYIGQALGTYLIAQADGAVYLIDQHAAQERCFYERLRKEFGQVASSQQELLVPLVLDYPLNDYLIIKQNREKLQQVGLHLAEFGQQSFIVRSHPTWFAAGQEEATIRQIIDWLLQDKQITVAQLRHDAAVMTSCKRAIKANHHLEPNQAKALLQQLAQCQNPYNCPHGRPVVVQFSATELEKMFKRIQDNHQSKRSQFER